ncbi:MAG: hypothetical protein ACPG3V_03685 [Porticoccaceae bacterium]
MKHCHLLSCKVASLTLVALITFVAGSGWAATFEGNLTVEKSSDADASDGNLIVEGTTTLKGNTTLGNQSSSDTITTNGLITVDSDLTVNGALKIQSVDSAGGGVVASDEGIAGNLSDKKIPTAKAVKDYVDEEFSRLWD